MPTMIKSIQPIQIPKPFSKVDITVGSSGSISSLQFSVAQSVASASECGNNISIRQKMSWMKKTMLLMMMSLTSLKDKKEVKIRGLITKLTQVMKILSLISRSRKANRGSR